MGLGDDTTYPNMVRYYQKLGCYDTGIFATDILTRVLFERGDGDLCEARFKLHDGVTFVRAEIMGSDGRVGYAQIIEV